MEVPSYLLVPLGSPENFDLRHHATVHVCGLPSNVDENDSTFDIEAVHTPRWAKYKPMPGKGQSVAIEGLLTGVERNEDRTVNLGPDRMHGLIKPAPPKNSHMARWGCALITRWLDFGGAGLPSPCTRSGPKHFIVDLQKVTFLGQVPVPPKAEHSPVKSGHPSTT
ncbi:hypothetical protein B0H10DRAFT_2231399 [Mycena sp. CBHHK59/15]|nr:hypothetical protein B0H10DRAFT_2231399 [Mycena sp. CBHHK59/15]